MSEEERCHREWTWCIPPPAGSISGFVHDCTLLEGHDGPCRCGACGEEETLP
jgi:hypothetical protein